MRPHDLFEQTPPPISALAYVARVVSAAYGTTVPNTMSHWGSNPRLIVAGPPPLRTWAWTWAERTCVAITGTTQRDELLKFVAGGALPSRLGAGQQNRFVEHLADQLFAMLPNDTFLLAGHSLGGAAAIILGRRFREAGLNVGGVVTFGAPRPTDLLGSADPLFPPVINVDAVGDPIPMYPPDGQREQWRRPGRVFALTNRNLMEDIESPRSPLEFFRGVNTLSSHDTTTYVSLLGPNPPPPPPPVRGTTPPPAPTCCFNS